MTVHMLDSVGYTSLHAAKYQAASHGKTDNLARQFLTIQILPLQECLPTDEKAQKIHKPGAGVIVNDVPDIPYPAGMQQPFASNQGKPGGDLCVNRLLDIT